MKTLKSLTALCVLATCATGNLPAQTGKKASSSESSSFESSSFESQKAQAQSAQAQRTDQTSNNDRDSSDRQRSESQSKYRISPAGWVQIAVDYDNDGMFDGIETIYAYDFEKARKSSQDRGKREAQRMSDTKRKSRGQNTQARTANSRRSGNAGNPSQNRLSTMRRSSETVSGKLLQLRDEQIMGMDDPCVIARVRKDNNMSAKVVLGPKSQVDSWGLAEGDEIKVSGRKGRVNDRPILLASKVTWGNKTKQVDLPSSRNRKRVQAELVSMRTTEFKGHDGQFVIAEIQSQSGKKCEVNLGAKSKVNQLNLREGDQLKLIVRPAKVNGKPGMVADQIMANGKDVNVSPPKNMTRRNRRSDSSMASKRKARDKDNKSQSESSSGEAALGIALGETGEGVVIVAVHPESPMVGKDVRVGDAIVSVNGKKVESASDLVSMIRDMKPGKNVKMKTNREGEENTVQAKLTTRQKLMQSYR